MKRLFKGRTSIIIAHRLSTIIECDAITLLEKGTVLETAPHAQLLECSGRYRELCMRQNLVLPKEQLVIPSKKRSASSIG